MRSPVGGWPAILGTLPAATLADDALGRHPDRLRALIVVGGDPAASLPDQGRARRALSALELLVCVDLFDNATTSLARAFLPAATWLERDQTGIHLAHQRPRSHLRFDRAVVPPRGQARSDWAILTALTRAAGRPAFGSGAAQAAVGAGLGPVAVARAVCVASGVPWAAVRSATGHVGSVGGPPPKGRFAVPRWCQALRQLPDPEPGLRLLTSVRRQSEMNHWLRPVGAEPPRVFVHPCDAPEGRARLAGPGGQVDVEVLHDSTLARGTVVWPFGDPRNHPNQVIGVERLEPFTGQPLSNGAEVRLDSNPGV